MKESIKYDINNPVKKEYIKECYELDKRSCIIARLLIIPSIILIFLLFFLKHADKTHYLFSNGIFYLALILILLFLLIHAHIRTIGLLDGYISLTLKENVRLLEYKNEFKDISNYINLIYPKRDVIKSEFDFLFSTYCEMKKSKLKDDLYGVSDGEFVENNNDNKN